MGDFGADRGPVMTKRVQGAFLAPRRQQKHVTGELVDAVSVGLAVEGFLAERKFAPAVVRRAAPPN